MLIKTLIEQVRPTLTATERRLADAIAANPAWAATSSVALIAADVGSHGSSVVRLARKLGYEGFPQLREALHREAFQACEPAERLRERLASLPSGEILADLVRQEAAALAELPTAMSSQRLDQAAGLLTSAQHVFACGEGNGRILVDLLSDRLGRLGRPTVAVSLTSRELARSLVAAQKADVLVAVALTRMPPILLRAMTAAHDAGLKVILISDPEVVLAHPLDPVVSVVLAVPRGPGNAMQTLVVPILLVTALVLATSKVMGTASLAAATRYGALRRALREPPP